MKQSYLLLFFALGLISAAQAEIYKRVDADGHVTYSSTPLKGSKVLILSPLPKTTAPAQSRTTAPRTAPQVRSNTGSPDFPRVDASTQKRRDNTRRQILEDELASEEKALRAAWFDLQESTEKPEVFIDKDGKVYSNAGKQQEKLKDLKDQVQLHEKNISALKAELARNK